MRPPRSLPKSTPAWLVEYVRELEADCPAEDPGDPVDRLSLLQTELEQAREEAKAAKRIARVRQVCTSIIPWCMGRFHSDEACSCCGSAQQAHDELTLARTVAAQEYTIRQLRERCAAIEAAWADAYMDRAVPAGLEVAADVLLARVDEISRYLGYGWENDSAYRTNLEGQRQAIQRLASELRSIARAKRKGDAPPKDRRPPRPPLPVADVKDPLTPPKLSPPARPSWPAPEQDPEVTAEDLFGPDLGGVEEP